MIQQSRRLFHFFPWIVLDCPVPNRTGSPNVVPVALFRLCRNLSNRRTLRHIARCFPRYQNATRRQSVEHRHRSLQRLRVLTSSSIRLDKGISPAILKLSPGKHSIQQRQGDLEKLKRSGVRIILVNKKTASAEMDSARTSCRVASPVSATAVPVLTPEAVSAPSTEPAHQNKPVTVRNTVGTDNKPKAAESVSASRLAPLKIAEVKPPVVGFRCAVRIGKCFFPTKRWESFGVIREAPKLPPVPRHNLIQQGFFAQSAGSMHVLQSLH